MGRRLWTTRLSWSVHQSQSLPRLGQKKYARYVPVCQLTIRNFYNYHKTRYLVVIGSYHVVVYYTISYKPFPEKPRLCHSTNTGHTR